MDAVPLQNLPCTAILFRAIIYPELIAKDGSHKVAAFIRRRESDPNGLSVSSTIQGCSVGMERGIFGVRSVHIGTLRDNGFDVFPDSPTHGNIRFTTGDLTPRRQDDGNLANDIGEVLLACSRSISYWNDQDADERFIRELEQARAARATGNPN